MKESRKWRIIKKGGYEKEKASNSDNGKMERIEGTRGENSKGIVDKMKGEE